MNISAINDVVIVKCKEKESVSLGGIILPTSGQQKQVQGVVVSVGPGLTDCTGATTAMQVKVGDSVVFPPGIGLILDEDEEIIAMRDSDIIAVVNNNRVSMLRQKVITEHIMHGERKIGNIIVGDDNGKVQGIRARWTKVHSVGPEVEDLVPGHWVLVQHGRWTRKLNLPEVDPKGEFRAIEYPHSVLMISETEPTDSVVLEAGDHYKKQY